VNSLRGAKGSSGCPRGISAGTLPASLYQTSKECRARKNNRDLEATEDQGGVGSTKIKKKKRRLDWLRSRGQIAKEPSNWKKMKKNDFKAGTNASAPGTETRGK